MESNNYNGVHILSEAVIMGGISMYFYKEISELKSTIEELKKQITIQNNQIQYILNSSQTPQQQSTLLRIPTPSQNNSVRQPQKESFQSNYLFEQQRYLNHKQSKLEQYQMMQSTIDSAQGAVRPERDMECEGGTCRLVRPMVEKKPKITEIIQDSTPSTTDKKVVISKISKQIEFDRENIKPDLTSKVNTFTDYSPNPLLRSVTPKPSTSANPIENQTVDDTKSTLEKILNSIKDE